MEGDDGTEALWLSMGSIVLAIYGRDSMQDKRVT